MAKPIFKLKLDNMRHYAKRNGYDFDIVILEDGVLLNPKSSVQHSFCVRRWEAIMSQHMGTAEYLLAIDSDTLFDNPDGLMEIHFTSTSP